MNDQSTITVAYIEDIKSGHRLHLCDYLPSLRIKTGVTYTHTGIRFENRQIVLPVALKPFFISLSSTYDTDLGDVISFRELQNTFKLYMDGIFKKREFNFPLKLVIGTNIRYECTMVGYELNVELFGPKCPKRYGFYIELIGQSLTIKEEQREPASLAMERIRPNTFGGGGGAAISAGLAIGLIGAAVSVDDQNNPALNEDDTSKSGSVGDIVTGEGIDLSNPDTWPRPPIDGPLQAGEPSKSKPRKRGEKSIFDSNGGEWRPHIPDNYHDKGHWDYKSPGNNTPWENIEIN